MLVHVLDHDDRTIDHRADRDCDSSERHDVRTDAHGAHGDECDQDANRQGDDRDQRRARVQQEHDAYDRHDDGFLQQLAAEILDRTVDQIAPIVDRAHDDSGRKSLGRLCELGLDARNRRERIFSEAHDDDAADRVASAVQIGHAAPNCRADTHAPELGDAHWCTCGGCTDDDILDVGDRFEVAKSPHHVLALGQLHHHRADIAVGALNGTHDARNRNAVREELGRVDVHLILLFESTHAGNFGDARHGRQRVAEIPVL